MELTRFSDLIVQLLAPLLDFSVKSGIGLNLEALDWLCREFKGRETLAERLRSGSARPPLLSEFYVGLEEKTREATTWLAAQEEKRQCRDG